MCVGKRRRYYFAALLAAAMFYIAAPAYTQEPTAATAASTAATMPDAAIDVLLPELDVDLRIVDAAPGGDGDGAIEPGETAALSFFVANYGAGAAPASLLVIRSSWTVLDELGVDLPDLGPAEGVEFDTRLELPAGEPLGTVTLRIDIFAAATQEAIGGPFEWVLENGRLVVADGMAVSAPTNVSGPAATTAPVVLEPGEIRGYVISAAAGEGVAAVVRVEGVAEAVTTADANGYFALAVTPGTYNVSFDADGLRRRVIEGVVVESAATTMLDAVLEPKQSEDVMGSGEVQEVVVETVQDRSKASVLLVVRKKAPVVSDAIGAEDIAKTADSTASGAVRRTVGTSVVGGKFVFVRGLGERYSYSLLNGAKISSPEPNQKVVPLDIFSAGVLSNLQVVKTATPDLPGDFAGGAVLIETKAIPDERVLGVGVSAKFNSKTTFRDNLAYAGGSRDAVARDDGGRAFPQALEDAPLNEYSLDEQNAIGRSLNNDFNLTRHVVGPSFGVDGEYGDRAELGKLTLGYFASAGYGRGFVRVTEEQRSFRLIGGGRLGAKTDFVGEIGEREASWDALGSLNLRVGGDHRVGATVLLTHSAVDQARLLTGFEQQESSDIRYTSQRFVQRSLLFNQLVGEHLIGPVEFDWHGVYSIAKREEPDWRQVVYARDESADRFLWVDKASSGAHFWTDLYEPAYSFAGDFRAPFLGWNDEEFAVKLGVMFNGRDRAFDIRRLRFVTLPGYTADDRALPPREQFSDDRIGTKIALEEDTLASDNYEGSEVVYASYAAGDLALAPKLRLIAGLRFEHSEIETTTFDPFSTTVSEISTVLTNDDFLPAANLVVAVQDDMNVRLGISQTIARPDFRELSPFSLSDFFKGGETRGNPELRQTKIINADVRWEMFPAEGEVLAASLFFKYFNDPIEQTIIPSTAGGENIFSFENADKAYNYGIEIEARSSFAFIHDNLRNFYVIANLMLGDSQVTLDPSTGAQTNNQRLLQGMSRVLVNLSLGYSKEEAFTLQANYNTFSKRIAKVGKVGLSDIYERPFHDLGVTYLQRLAKHWSFKLALSNLLFEEFLFTQYDAVDAIDKVAERLERGMTVGISIDYKL